MPSGQFWYDAEYQTQHSVNVRNYQLSYIPALHMFLLKWGFYTYKFSGVSLFPCGSGQGGSRSHCSPLDDLEVAMCTRLTSNWKRSACFCLSSAVIKSEAHVLFVSLFGLLIFFFISSYFKVLSVLLFFSSLVMVFIFYTLVLYHRYELLISNFIH